MPQAFRDQFDKDAIASCTPKPETMYCLPYTGFNELLFRNLTVLKEAGIDASAPSKDWAEWFEQMKKVKAAGKFAMPDQAQVFNSVASTYSIVGLHEEWGIDFGAKKTKINPETYATRTSSLTFSGTASSPVESCVRQTERWSADSRRR